MAKAGRDDIERLAAAQGWTVEHGRGPVHGMVLSRVAAGTTWRLTASLHNMEGPGMDELRFQTGPVPGATTVVLQADSRGSQGNALGSAEPAIAMAAVAAAVVGAAFGRLFGRTPRPAEAARHPFLPELTVSDPLGVLSDIATAGLVRGAPHNGARPTPAIGGSVVGLANRPAGFALICKGRMDEPGAILAVVAAGVAVVERMAALAAHSGRPGTSSASSSSPTSPHGQ